MAKFSSYVIRCVLFIGFCSSSFMAAGGTLTFSGAITEPVCTVKTSSVPMTSLSASANTPPILLNVHCNESQNMQISLSEVGASTDSKIFSGSADVAISQKANLAGAGDKIFYSFEGKKDIQVPFTAVLRKASNLTAEAMHSRVLVSFEYP